MFQSSIFILDSKHVSIDSRKTQNTFVMVFCPNLLIITLLLYFYVSHRLLSLIEHIPAVCSSAYCQPPRYSYHLLWQDASKIQLSFYSCRIPPRYSYHLLSQDASKIQLSFYSCRIPPIYSYHLLLKDSSKIQLSFTVAGCLQDTVII